MSPAAPPTRLVAFVLLAACFLLAGLLYRQIVTPPEPVGMSAAHGAVAHGETAAPSVPDGDPFPVFDPPMAAELAEIIDRPLFSDSRRPSIRAADAGDATTGKPAFVLRGVVLADRRRSALLEPENAPKLVHVVEGEELSGWKVSEVRQDMVVLTQDGDRVEIFLADLAPKETTAKDVARRKKGQARRRADDDGKQPRPADD